MLAQFYFPLHILVISNLAHDDDIHGLSECLKDDPAVRSIGFTGSREEGKNMLFKYREINTIMIDPSSGHDSPATYIKELRKEFPKIVFVIFTRPWIRDYFLKQHPEFEHYFYIRHYDVINTGLFQTKNIEDSDCYKVLRRCEQWHKESFEYDFGLSFAGSNRELAERIATGLELSGAHVFYDNFEQSELLGQNLYTYLYELYSKRCRYCIMLISKDYIQRMWTNHERVAAQERMLKERGGLYILPIKLDQSEVLGLPSSIAYLSLEIGVEKIISIIIGKLWVQDTNAPKRLFSRENYY